MIINEMRIPHFLLGITKSNLSVNTIHNIQASKVYKQAETLAKAEENSMLYLNHHILDERGVRYLQEILAQNRTVDNHYRESILRKESETVDSFFKSPDSKRYALNLVFDISEQTLI